MPIVATFAEGSPHYESAGLDYDDGIFTILGADPTDPESIRAMAASGELVWASKATQKWFDHSWPEDSAAERDDERRRLLWITVLAVCAALCLLLLGLLWSCTRSPAQLHTIMATLGQGGSGSGTTPHRSFKVGGGAALAAVERCEFAVQAGTSLEELRSLAAKADVAAHDFEASVYADTRPNFTADLVKAADLWTMSVQAWQSSNAEAAKNYRSGLRIWNLTGRPGTTPTLREYVNTNPYTSLWGEATAMTQEARMLFDAPWDESPPH